MMFKSIIGYILAAIGLLGILFSSEQIKATVPFLVGIPSNVVLIAGFAFLAVGVVIMIITGKSSRQQAEVPIYRGKEIVGYRRLK